MKQLILAAVFASIGTGILIVADQRRHSHSLPAQTRSDLSLISKETAVHAAGRIEGTTENVLIRSHFPGRIDQVVATRGMRVERGQTLFTLESRRYEAQRDLAAARLSAARAQRMRLVDGARQSEIEAANQDAAAALARYEGSRTRFERANRLFERNALSPQDLEDHRTEHDANLAFLMASRERLQTIKADPRTADLLAADAAIASAEAELQIADIDLQRCKIVSPCPAIVLAVDVRAGEWTSPELPDAALELSNTERLRVVANIDERDSLRVSIGHQCQITADAMPGQSYSGTVTEIEPRMEPKKIYGGWAGERNETHARRVWIDLQTDQMLPVGLPVEVMISTATSDL